MVSWAAMMYWREVQVRVSSQRELKITDNRDKKYVNLEKTVRISLLCDHCMMYTAYLSNIEKKLTKLLGYV